MSRSTLRAARPAAALLPFFAGFFLASVVASPARAATQVVVLHAVDSDSISASGQNLQDNRLRAYWNDQTGFVDGFVKFDLSALPPLADVTALTLRTYHEAFFGDPVGGPEVRLWRVADDTWSRATLDPHPDLGVPVSSVHTSFPSADLAPHDWPLDLTAMNVQDDLADGVLSIAMRNENTSTYGHVYWYGSDAAPAPPELVVEFDVCPGPGSMLTFGQGCPGQGGFEPVLVGSGCATPGGTVTLRVARGVPGETAFVFFGGQKTQLPVGFGCDLLVAPPQLLLALPLSGAAAGEGHASLTAVVPAGLPTPLTVELQAFLTDSATPAGFSATQGLEVTVGG